MAAYWPLMNASSMQELDSHLDDVDEGLSTSQGIFVALPVHNSGSCIDEPPSTVAVLATVEGMAPAVHFNIRQQRDVVGLLACVPRLRDSHNSKLRTWNPAQVVSQGPGCEKPQFKYCLSSLQSKSRV